MPDPEMLDLARLIARFFLAMTKEMHEYLGRPTGPSDFVSGADPPNPLDIWSDLDMDPVHS